MVMTIEP